LVRKRPHDDVLVAEDATLEPVIGLFGHAVSFLETASSLAIGWPPTGRPQKVPALECANGLRQRLSPSHIQHGARSLRRRKPSSSSRPWGKSRSSRMGGGTAGTARAPTSVAQRGHRREARSPDGDGNEAIDRSLDTEVRHRRVALGEEEIERVLV